MRIVLAQLRRGQAGHLAADDVETRFFKAANNLANVLLVHAIRLTND